MNKEQIAGMLEWINRHDPFIVVDPLTVNAWHDVLKNTITAEWCKGFLISYYAKPNAPRITVGIINEAWSRRKENAAIQELQEAAANAVPMPQYMRQKLQHLAADKAV
jgi:hypothetical protein